ncbi:hypothetical protein SLS58_002196 [Diplodia intermedia]|uniref:B30.2/SPRY domain-containing protein n=1 Tax=Diplodia intermedia TaxID=856260 RepID=A0ABR3TZV7_9PEZI
MSVTSKSSKKTSGKPVAVSAELWIKAEKIFYKEYDRSEVKTGRAQLSLRHAIRELKKGPPESSEKDHGRVKRTENGKRIATINRRRILQKLELLLEFGNTVMAGAPETVALVWMGLSAIGKIFIVNSKVSEMIEETTEQMAEAILICEVYGLRYLKGRVKDQFDGTQQSLLNKIPKLMALALKFFHLANKHMKKNVVGKRILKPVDRKSVEAKSQIRDLQDTARIDFEDTALSLLREAKGSSAELPRLKGLVKDAFESISSRLADMHDLQAAAEIERSFNASLKWFQDGHRIPLKSPVDRYLENISEEKRHKGSCSWIFDEKKFQEWTSQSSGALCLTGQGGVGKTVLASTVIEHFEQLSKKQTKAGKKQNFMLLYFFCKLGDPHAAAASNVMLHLCAQLFQKAADGDSQEKLYKQKDCIAVVEKAKADLADSERKLPASMKMSSLMSLFKNLGSVFGLPLVVVLDAVDECTDQHFPASLRDLASSSKIKARILFSSRSKPSRIEHIQIDRTKTDLYIEKYVRENIDKLKKQAESWTKKVRMEATEDIVSFADGNFLYASSVMEYIRKPEKDFLPYAKIKPELPRGTNGLYKQKISRLNEDRLTILVTVLRWLICGTDSMELLPIADELSSTYPSVMDGDISDDEALEEPDLGKLANSLAQIGRDFLKITGTTVQLEHNSVRDFVLSRTDKRVADAGMVEGHLRMSEYLMRTLNSPQFRKRFLSDKALGSWKKQVAGKSETHLRYELEHWPRHLRDTEIALGSRKNGGLYKSRWNQLLAKAEEFMSRKNDYQVWLKLSSTTQEDYSGDSMLHTAARYGLESLFGKHASENDIKAPNKHANTPLHLVCLGDGGFRGLDELLASSIMDTEIVNAKNKEGATPIILAAKNTGEDPKLIKQLLDHHADPTIADKSGATCLHFAAGSHKTEVCRVLLAHGSKNGTKRVDVNAEDSNGETPLHWACKLPDAPKELIRLLLKNGAAVNAQDKESQAPLYEASKSGSAEVVKLLLSKHADINDDDVNRNTALHAAITNGNLAIVKTLVNHNAGALDMALKQHDEQANQTATIDIDAYKALVASAAQKVNAVNIFAEDSSKRDAVTCAAAREEFEIMAFLLEVHEQRASNLDFLLQPDRKGLTALHHCVKWKNYPAVRQLLEMGSGKRETDHGREPKNTRNELAVAMCKVAGPDGDQPLHMAAWLGYRQIVKVLLKYGAPFDTHRTKKSIYGRTPLDAAFGGWQEKSDITPGKSRAFEGIISELLKEHGSSEISGSPLKLKCAIERGSKDVFKLLQERQPEKDEYGWTPDLVSAYYNFNQDGKRNLEELSRQGTHPPTRWRKTNKVEGLDVSKDGLVVSLEPHETPLGLQGSSKTFTRSIRANNPVQPRKKHFYFEVKILEDDNDTSDPSHSSDTSKTNTPPGMAVGIGFCTKLALLNNTLPGDKNARALTWGYRSDSGHTYTPSNQGKEFSDGFGPGDTVGCGVKFDQGLGRGVIYYTLNGRHLGGSTYLLHRPARLIQNPGNAFKEVKGQLFPVVGLRSSKGVKVSVRANFGKDSFQYEETNGS